MMDEQEDNSRLGWFLAGVAIGAAIALLYAPKSGKETRRYLSNSTKDGRESLEAGGRELMDRGREIYERGKQIAEDAADLFERGRKLVQS